MTFNPEQVSQCPSCGCMSHTLKDKTCGKCKAQLACLCLEKHCAACKHGKDIEAVELPEWDWSKEFDDKFIFDFAKTGGIYDKETPERMYFVGDIKSFISTAIAQAVLLDRRSFRPQAVQEAKRELLEKLNKAGYPELWLAPVRQALIEAAKES